MRMRTQKRKTLPLHSARLHTVATRVLTNVTPPPPPINFYLLLQRSGGRGCCNCSSVIGTYPCGSPHRPESLYREAFLSQRGHVRLSPWKRKSTYVDRFCSLTSHINLSAVKNRFSLFACKSFLVEQFVFPAYNFAAVRREFLLRYAA